MVHSKPNNDVQDTIGGMTLGAWDERWKLVPEGFTRPQHGLRHSVGLFAAKMGGEFMYIGAAANRKGNGLSGALARAYHQNASGDKGWGKRMLQEHRSEVAAYVIALPRSAENIALIGELKKAFVKLHAPAWNQPETVRNQAIRASYRKTN